MYGCESWTVKKAEYRRIDAFELWCWRRLLRVPWTASRSSQSILKQISPGCSLEGLMLKLKLLILRQPDVKSWLIWKDHDGGKEWRQEKGTTEDEMVGWHHWLNGHVFGWTLRASDGQEGLVCCGSWGHKESDTTEQLNWTEIWFSYRWCVNWWELPKCFTAVGNKGLPSNVGPIRLRTFNVRLLKSYKDFDQVQWTKNQRIISNTQFC